MGGHGAPVTYAAPTAPVTYGAPAAPVTYGAPPVMMLHAAPVMMGGGLNLPFQPERHQERDAMFQRCDPNGNGYCSFAEIDACFRNMGVGEHQKMTMLHCFDQTKNYGGKESGVAADYIEHKEFRIFLELLAQNGI